MKAFKTQTSAIKTKMSVTWQILTDLHDKGKKQHSDQHEQCNHVGTNLHHHYNIYIIKTRVDNKK